MLNLTSSNNYNFWNNKSSIERNLLRVELPFLRMLHHRLKCNTYSRLSNTLLQDISVSLGHRHVYTLLLKLLHCLLSTSHVYAFLFIIMKSLKSLKFHEVTNSAAQHLLVRCGFFVCCGGV